MDACFKMYTFICIVLLAANIINVNGKYSIYAQEGGEIQSDEFGHYYPPYHEMGGDVDGNEEGFMSDWNRHWPTIHGNQPKCIDIPANLSLCRGIGYDQMRLPNLLDHDTLQEVTTQASTWVPLLGIACHPDTQLFLCSLFSPVCLDRPIYPCRNLCLAVKSGCEKRMLRYGFPWPEILDCEKFPLNNDLCIGPQSESQDSSRCEACNQPPTFEAFVDNFCRAKTVMRVKIRKETDEGTGKKLKVGKKKRLYKRGNLKKKELAKLDLYIDNSEKCDCGLPEPGKENSQYFAMGEKRGDKFYVQGMHIYDKTNRAIKKALRAIRKKDDICQKKGIDIIAANDDPYLLDRPKTAKTKRGKSNKKSKKQSTTNPVLTQTDISDGDSTSTIVTPISKSQNEAKSSKNKKSKKGRNRNRDNGNERRQRGDKKSRTRDRTPQPT